MKKLLLSAALLPTLFGAAHAEIKLDTTAEECEAIAPTLLDTVGMHTVVSVKQLTTHMCTAQMRQADGQVKWVAWYFFRETEDGEAKIHWFVK